LLAEETADIADGFEEDIEGSDPDAFEMRFEFGEYEGIHAIGSSECPSDFDRVQIG
jgi:hypothetical protein